MLIESIELSNFRQFVNEKIEFSVDKDKNVTLIIGDNGTGKTTFAQAFFWCFYGETSFQNKVMLNRDVERNMLPDEKREVRVKIKLKHGSAEYEIIRTQEYKKTYSSKINQTNTVLHISIRQEDGNYRFLKPSECELEIKKILPRELANYFFFDGERIEKLSKEISKGKKSSGFAEAVEGLTGLKATTTALVHLNPKNRNTVMGKFNESYSGNSAEKINEYTQKINALQNELFEIDERLAQIDDEISEADANRSNAEIEIQQYADGEKLHKEKVKKEKELDDAKIAKAGYIKAACKVFNKAATTDFLSLSLVKKAVEIVCQKKMANCGIPRLHVETLDHLLKRGVCLCGTQLNEGSLPHHAITDLLDYAAPNSAGDSINTFIELSKMKYSEDKTLDRDLAEYTALISQQDEKIEDILAEIGVIESQLNGENVQQQVKQLNQKIKFYKTRSKDLREEEKAKAGRRAIVEEAIKEKEAGRRELTLVDKNNKQIELYKAYTQALFDYLYVSYLKEEKVIRENLQNTINEIFQSVFNGAMSIKIDEKYNIEVNVYDDDGIETSTAQSITVIFAFITAIIKMARENQMKKGNISYSEPYPLVMDAPLSAFDKKRIKAICTSLPKVAEQIIVFIKDTDGDLANEHLGDKVMTQHYFEKIDDLHTKLH